jgi:hypothetical protein
MLRPAMSEPRDENEPEAPSKEADPDPGAPEATAADACTDTAPPDQPPRAGATAEPKEAAVVPEKPAGGAAPKKKAAKKKKKKKKAVAAETEPGAAEAEDEKAAPKPLPGLGTPDGEKLARALRAFEAGNYALVRTLTIELEQAADPEVKEYAKGLRRRIDVDPIQIVVLVACLALFLVIAYVYVLE